METLAHSHSLPFLSDNSRDAVKVLDVEDKIVVREVSELLGQALWSMPPLSVDLRPVL